MFAITYSIPRISQLLQILTKVVIRPLMTTGILIAAVSQIHPRFPRRLSTQYYSD